MDYWAQGWIENGFQQSVAPRIQPNVYSKAPVQTQRNVREVISERRGERNRDNLTRKVRQKVHNKIRREMRRRKPKPGETYRAWLRRVFGEKVPLATGTYRQYRRLGGTQTIPDMEGPLPSESRQEFPERPSTNGQAPTEPVEAVPSFEVPEVPEMTEQGFQPQVYSEEASAPAPQKPPRAYELQQDEQVETTNAVPAYHEAGEQAYRTEEIREEGDLDVDEQAYQDPWALGQAAEGPSKPGIIAWFDRLPPRQKFFLGIAVGYLVSRWLGR